VIAFPVVFAVAIRLFVPIVALRARDVLGAMAPVMVACSGMYLVVTAVRAAFGLGHDRRRTADDAGALRRGGVRGLSQQSSTGPASGKSSRR
jgi:hypothetical protein